MELSPGWVTAGVAVVGGVAGWLRSVDAAQDRKLNDFRGTQRTLFEKYDTVAHALQEYKLHVAETYVNQAALEKLLIPIERRLETIEKDLRQPRA